MAQGRMLHSRVSRNVLLPRLHQLANERVGSGAGGDACLLYLMCIPHLDKEARMDGDPCLVRGKSVPRFSAMTDERVEVFIKLMHEIGLVVWYEVGGCHWLFFPGMRKAQIGWRPDREPDSEIPPPPANCRQCAVTPPPEEEEEVEHEEKTFPGSVTQGGQEGLKLDPPGSEPGFDFEAVYALYPRKEGRKKGLQRCRSQIRTREKYDALLIAVRNYATAKADVESQFIKHFDSWMNGPWEDWVSPTPQMMQPRAGPRSRSRGMGFTD
jgi:hypothetical protein